MSVRGVWWRLAGLTAALLIMSAAAIGLLVVRIGRAGQPAFGFLVWNLVLAWVPFLLALIMTAVHDRRGPRLLLWILGVVWILFLPNAPYIMTDFVHLGRASGVPLWFDAALIGSFAAVGLILGLSSLFAVHRVVEARAGRVLGWLLALASLVLSAIGIYLGRFVRFNSWDVLADPGSLAMVIVQRMSDPLGNPFLLRFAVLLSAMLIGAYAITWILGRGLLGPALRSPERSATG